MTIINIIFFALIWVAIGQVKTRRIFFIIPAISYLFYVNSANLPLCAAFLLLFAVIRTLPTHAMFSAIHGNLPRRDDGRWQFLQDIADKVSRNGYEFGIDYGFFRASLAIPAMLYIGGWSWVFLAQGFIYWFCGRINPNNAVLLAEIITGAIFGVIL